MTTVFWSVILSSKNVFHEKKRKRKRNNNKKTSHSAHNLNCTNTFLSSSLPLPFFFFFLAYHSMQKFLVQGLNLSCSSNCSSNQSTDNAESLTTRLPENSIQGLFFEKAIGLWLLCSKGTKRYYLFGHTEY